MKPEVVYEVCHPRTSGPYSHKHYNVWTGKYESKQRPRRHKIDDCDVEYAGATLSAVQNEEFDANEVTNESERTPLSIATWIGQAENGQSPQHHTKTPESAPSRVRKAHSRKGKAIYMPEVRMIFDRVKRCNFCNKVYLPLPSLFFKMLLYFPKTCNGVMIQSTNK